MRRGRHTSLDKHRAASQEQLTDHESDAASKAAAHRSPTQMMPLVDHTRGAALASQKRPDKENAGINENPDDLLRELAAIRQLKRTL